jgi:Tol biopolymer transport system component
MVSMRAAAKRAHPGGFARRALVAALAVALAAIAGAAPAPGQRLVTAEGIVFESTRDGNSEIYAMTPSGGVQVRLTNNTALDAAPTVSPGGKIVFATNRDANWNLYQLGPGGKEDAPVSVGPAVDFGAAWSPDGHTLAFTRSAADPGLSEIYAVDASTRKEGPITHLGGQNFAPSFSPSGDRFAFVHGARGRFHIEIAGLDGTVQADLSARTGHNADFDPAWSPSGTEIAFSRRDRSGNYDLWTMQVATASERQLTKSRLEDSSPSWSPDGGRIAFVRGGDGAYEIYSMNADGSAQRDLTNSIAGANLDPHWSANVPFGNAVAGADGVQGSPTAGLFCTKVGTARGETLNGTGGIDVICGLGGRDTIRGLGAGDVLAGGTGSDRLLGGAGGDELFARVGFGLEHDVVSGGAGASDMAWIDRGLDITKRDVEVRRPP